MAGYATYYMNTKAVLSLYQKGFLDDISKGSLVFVLPQLPFEGSMLLP